MYVVREYIEENPVDSIKRYGVYIKSDYSGYKIDIDCNDNLVVLCNSEEIAYKIARLLNIDEEIEEI